MFHLLANAGDMALATPDLTINAVTDEVFMDRNNGFIFTEPWAAMALFTHGLTQTRVRTNVPKLNAINRHNIFPLNNSATIPSNPQIQDLRAEPLVYPQNETFLWQGTITAVGPEQNRVFAYVISPDWTREFPAHLQRITIRASGAVAGVLNNWSLFGPLTFNDSDLRGGVYSIIGAQVFDAGVVAFRFLIPRQKDVNGRKLRPGGIAMEALGNVPNTMQSTGLGEWGRFHTFEPPQLQIFANAAGASVQDLRIDLLYLGEDPALLQGTM